MGRFRSSYTGCGNRLELCCSSRYIQVKFICVLNYRINNIATTYMLDYCVTVGTSYVTVPIVNFFQHRSLIFIDEGILKICLTYFKWYRRSVKQANIYEQGNLNRSNQ